MHAFSCYAIDLEGKKRHINAATKVFAEALDDDSIIGMDHIEIEETYEVVWVESIAAMAEKAVKAAPKLKSLTISGTVDTSESAGEYMDFLIKYADKKLTVQSSCWYLAFYADDFEDYENFCEVYDGFSEEEYEEMCRCPHYRLDSGEGDIVTKVPLDEPEIIDLDAAVVYVSEEAAKELPVRVCKCKCRREVFLECEQNEVFGLFTGKSLTAVCKKCGRKYKVYLE